MIQAAPINPAMVMGATQVTGQGTGISADFATLMAQMMGQGGGTDADLLAQLFGDNSQQKNPTDPTNAMEMMAGLFFSTPADVNFALSPMAYNGGTAQGAQTIPGMAQQNAANQSNPLYMTNQNDQANQMMQALLNAGQQKLDPAAMTLNGEPVDPQVMQALLNAQKLATPGDPTGTTTQSLAAEALLNLQQTAQKTSGQSLFQSVLETLAQTDPKLAAELAKNGGIVQEQTPVTQTLDPAQSAYAKLYRGQTAGETAPKPGAKTDVEALQQAVDNGSYLPQSLTATKESAAAPHEMEILRQVQTGILENLQKDKNEFTIKLRPEGLGNITVKMTETAGKISLSIITSTQQAQSALSGELSSLKEALRPYNAEIAQIVQSNDNAAFQQQTMGDHRHNGQQEAQQRQTAYYRDSEAEAPPEIQQEYARLVGTALNAHI